MRITAEQLKAIAPTITSSRIATFLDPINDAMEKYNITSPAAQAMFLAQIMHESGACRYVRELASGAAYDTGRLAVILGNTPDSDGDGQKYKGRGLIQITGTNNYRDVSKALGVDFLKEPELLEKPEYAALSAAWYWHSRGLNEIAEKNDLEAFKLVTKKINGGYNGLADRLSYWNRAKTVLGC